MPQLSATSIERFLKVGGEDASDFVAYARELEILAGRFEDLLAKHAPEELTAFQRQVQEYNAAWKDSADGHALWTTKAVKVAP